MRVTGSVDLLHVFLVLPVVFVVAVVVLCCVKAKIHIFGREQVCLVLFHLYSVSSCV